jgi:transcription antitermination factor NusG
MSISSQDSVRWLVVQVRPRSEIACASLLARKGYETFVPLRFESDRPLFSGYVFARPTGDTAARVVTTPGVIRLVVFDGRPAEIECAEIESIRSIVRSGAPYRAGTVFEAGDRVRILDGALAGVEGVVYSIKSRRKLLVSISLLQRSVMVDIEACRLTRVPPQIAKVASR